MHATGTVGDRSALSKHVGEALVLERRVLDVLHRQVELESVRDVPGTLLLIRGLAETLAAHVAELTRWLEAAGESVPALRNAAAAVGNAFTGAVASLHEHPVSRLLCDDYTDCNAAAASAQMLYTVALAHHEPELAQLALAHLRDLVPTIMALSRLLPHAVASDVARSEGGDPTVGTAAELATHDAWQSHGWHHAEFDQQHASDGCEDGADRAAACEVSADTDYEPQNIER